MSPINEIKQNPNIFLITIGAILWLIGLYNIPLIGPFFMVIGFGMTASAVAISSLQRPTTKAIAGLLLGGIIQLIGYYLAWIPLINLIAPPMIVLGGVMILYFAIPLAIQTGKVPFIEEIHAQLKKEKASDSSEEPTKEKISESESVE